MPTAVEAGDGKQVHTRQMRPRQPAKKPHLPNSPFRAAEAPVIPDFAVNDRVTHDRHGLGSVVKVTGDRIHVRFGENTVSVAMSSSKIHPL
jgi:hypothetical protein